MVVPARTLQPRRAGAWPTPVRPLLPAEPARAPSPGGWWALLRALVQQWRVERELRRRSPRTADARVARDAYDTLTAEQFEAFNGPQRWSHARVLPQLVAAALPARAVVALDLGCGSGDSTAWLARCTEAGSRIVAYDFSGPRLASARRRRYQHADGSAAAPAFVCQAITEPLRAADGSALPAHSVDLVLASGVVGHHLAPDGAARLAAELRRVLRHDGAAVLDAGPRLRGGALRAIMRAAGFVQIAKRRLSPFNCRAQSLFRPLP